MNGLNLTETQAQSHNLQTLQSPTQGPKPSTTAQLFFTKNKRTHLAVPGLLHARRHGIVQRRVGRVPIVEPVGLAAVATQSSQPCELDYGAVPAVVPLKQHPRVVRDGLLHRCRCTQVCGDNGWVRHPSSSSWVSLSKATRKHVLAIVVNECLLDFGMGFFAFFPCDLARLGELYSAGMSPKRRY